MLLPFASPRDVGDEVLGGECPAAVLDADSASVSMVDTDIDTIVDNGDDDGDVDKTSAVVLSFLVEDGKASEVVVVVVTAVVSRDVLNAFIDFRMLFMDFLRFLGYFSYRCRWSEDHSTPERFLPVFFF